MLRQRYSAFDVGVSDTGISQLPVRRVGRPRKGAIFFWFTQSIISSIGMGGFGFRIGAGGNSSRGYQLMGLYPLRGATDANVMGAISA